MPIQTFTFNQGQSTFTLPLRINKITVEAWGAAGGSNTILVPGGYVKANLKVTPGSTLTIGVGGVGGAPVGQVGGLGGLAGPTLTLAGGNGGGSEDMPPGGGYGGGAGTYILAEDFLVVAGGGGGKGGGNLGVAGGAGGPSVAASGTTIGFSEGGGGGTTATPGAGGGAQLPGFEGSPGGVDGNGGAGGYSFSGGGGGGGGGGWQAGGGGGAGDNGRAGAGGGGGANFVDSQFTIGPVTSSAAVCATTGCGDGLLIISYNYPSNYKDITIRTACCETAVYYSAPNAVPKSGSLFPRGTTIVHYKFADEELCFKVEILGYC